MRLLIIALSVAVIGCGGESVTTETKPKANPSEKKVFDIVAMSPDGYDPMSLNGRLLVYDDSISMNLGDSVIIFPVIEVKNSPVKTWVYTDSGDTCELSINSKGGIDGDVKYQAKAKFVFPKSKDMYLLLHRSK